MLLLLVWKKKIMKQAPDCSMVIFSFHVIRHILMIYRLGVIAHGPAPFLNIITLLGIQTLNENKLNNYHDDVISSSHLMFVFLVYRTRTFSIKIFPYRARFLFSIFSFIIQNKRPTGLNSHLSIRDFTLTSCQKGSY